MVGAFWLFQDVAARCVVRRPDLLTAHSCSLLANSPHVDNIRWFWWIPQYVTWAGLAQATTKRKKKRLRWLRDADVVKCTPAGRTAALVLAPRPMPFRIQGEDGTFVFSLKTRMAQQTMAKESTLPDPTAVFCNTSLRL